MLNDVEHSASDGKSIEPGERGKGSERASKMKRSNKRSCSYFAAAALRIKESEAVEEFDFVGRANASVKIFEVGAAAESDVLAIIDVLAVG